MPRGSTTATKPSPIFGRWKAKGYQKKGIRRVIGQACAGLFLDPGLGKTSISLASYILLKDAKMVRGALVVAPLRPAYQTWPEQIEGWEDFSGLKYEILHGPRKDAALKRKADIYIINPEGLRWLFKKLGPNRHKWPFDMLILDESTKFKNTTTERFNTIKPHLKRFRRRYILTGSPAPNGLQDLFGQIYCLDEGAALGQFVTHYRMEFFDAHGYGDKHYRPRPGAEEKIYKKLSKLVLRMDAEDYLELPPLVQANHYVNLPPKVRKLYDEMEQEFFYQIDTGVSLSAINSGAASSKLRQIANGGAYIDDAPGTKMRRAVDLHSEKLDVLVDLLEELSGQPALVAFEFHHDRERLLEGLSKAGFGDVPYIGGGVTPKQGKKIQDQWNAGELAVVLGNPQSMAHGLNLQRTGRAVIWYSLTWDYELYDQFIRRIWRQGQTGRVFVHHILARDTVDEAVFASLHAKHRTQKTLLDALRAYSLTRRERLQLDRQNRVKKRTERTG